MYEQGTGAMPTSGSYSYTGMSQPVTKFNNPLNADQIKKLMQHGEQFTVSITEEQMLRAVCNHRNLEGTGDALVYDPVTGQARCTICGYSFKPIDPDVKPEEIREDVLNLIDILQTIKLMYIDLPPEAAFEFFPIIALLEKTPQLFEFAAKNMAKHESYNWQWNNRNMGAINMFNNLQNMFGGLFNGAPATYGAPAAGGPAPGVAGWGAPAPGVVPGGFGYPGATPGMPMGNPAAFMGQGSVAYSPETNNFRFTPGMAGTGQPQGAPEAAPAPADGTTTVTQSVTP